MSIANNFELIMSKAQALSRNIGAYRYKEVCGALKSAYQAEIGQAAKAQIENINRTFMFYVPNSVLKPFNKAKTEGDLCEAIFSFGDRYSKEVINPILKGVNLKKKSVPLEVEQEFYKKKNFADDCVRWIHAIFSRPSRKAEVVEIETILREKYGLELVLLGDDLTVAKNVLKAIEDAKTAGIKLPEEVIVTDFKIGCEHLRTSMGKKDTILLSSTRFQLFQQKHSKRINLSTEQQGLLKSYRENCGYASWNSTNQPEHVALHEIVHETHLPLLAFKTKKIPSKYLPTIRKLSGYAASKPTATHEIYTELMTRKVLVGLDKEQEELLDFIVNKMK